MQDICRNLEHWGQVSKQSKDHQISTFWSRNKAHLLFNLNSGFFRFQEIVPLNAGNVLVTEDTEPAAKWLALISLILNKPRNHFPKDDSSSSKPETLPQSLQQDQKLESSDEDSPPSEKNVEPQSCTNYCLVLSKQMVGIFVSGWVRSDLVQHVGHVRVTSLGRGIMSCLGNKVDIRFQMQYAYHVPVTDMYVQRAVPPDMQVSRPSNPQKDIRP